jgi:hypothetical protein
MEGLTFQQEKYPSEEENIWNSVIECFRMEEQKPSCKLASKQGKT